MTDYIRIVSDAAKLSDSLTVFLQKLPFIKILVTSLIFLLSFSIFSTALYNFIVLYVESIKRKKSRPEEFTNLQNISYTTEFFILITSFLIWSGTLIFAYYNFGRNILMEYFH